MKNQYDIDTIRHSTAHVMAQAITELFGEDKVQLGIGPTTEQGFYYDIDLEHRLTAEDLERIEGRMKEIIKAGNPITRVEIEKNEAIKLFQAKQQHLKIELIESFPPGEAITYYQHGQGFLDLCRGPHVRELKDLPSHFKLLHTAGAYWRGDQERSMLQRVYAVCFLKAEELAEHLHFLEEAKKRDHRKLGKELELFIFDPLAPASPFFMPKGTQIYNGLVEFMRQVYRYYDYQEVITPQVLDAQLWHQSGHYENYKENMYFTKVEDREFALKPMNCPCHMLMYQHHLYSYRDLPLRFADFGRLHRFEKSGVVSGLTRVRTFCQDDAHVFLSQEQITGEIANLLEMFFLCYRHFGFHDIRVQLSTRPEKKLGDDATWDQAEQALIAGLESQGISYTINAGDGAFYGPKIDVGIADALKRYHQLGTIQLDFQLPQRFDLSFTNHEGKKERPIVIHRALLGSLERFIGVYLEHVAGVFPFWLAPVQVAIIPVSNERHLPSAEILANELKQLGIRVQVNNREETLGNKTRLTQTQKIPYMIVIGDREQDLQSLSLRAYGTAKAETMSKDQALALFEEKQLEKLPLKLRSAVK